MIKLLGPHALKQLFGQKDIRTADGLGTGLGCMSAKA